MHKIMLAVQGLDSAKSEMRAKPQNLRRSPPITLNASQKSRNLQKKGIKALVSKAKFADVAVTNNSKQEMMKPENLTSPARNRVAARYGRWLARTRIYSAFRIYPGRLANHGLIAAVVLILGSISPGPVLGNEPITPLPLSIDVDKAKARLGKTLFFDKRLSADNSISCASCHELTAAWGTDLRPVSAGLNGQLGSRNAPTVYNSVFNFTQFWDGRAESLADQARGPVVNPIEMGMPSWDAAIKKIEKDATYQRAFKSLYAAGMTADTIVDAIAEYEKTLITPNAPFDQYLRGKTDAIDETQKRGYKLFKSYGCISCHQGQNVGGNMFQKFGVLKDIALQSGSLSNDLGRYNLTKNEWDKRVFKVPSLRLAIMTPPYFHDGSVATIDEAVAVMIQFQLGRDVPEKDKQAIVAFLTSLVGELPKGVN